MRFLLILSVLLPVLLPAMAKARNINISGNYVRVNGVKLEFKNEMNLKQKYDGESIEISIGAGEIDLTENAEGIIDIIVTYYEYEENDAAIIMDGSKLSYKTKSSKPACISSVRGTVPYDTDLIIDTGSGNISLKGFSKSSRIICDTGSGSISIQNVKDCEVIDADTGSGNIYMQDVDNITRIKMDTGSGLIKLKGGKNLSSVAADTGSGSCYLIDIYAEFAKMYTGSGSVVIRNSEIDSAVADTGSGNIRIENSIVKERVFDTGSGKILETETSH